MKTCVAILFMFITTIKLFAQDDLMDLLEKETEPTTNYTESTFKGTRLINGHSIETRKKGVLDFIIGHRFGRINSGAYEFFGLDQSNVRIGFDYGLTDRFNIGIGRNSFEKTYDSFLKYKLMRQQTGSRQLPVSIVAFSSIAIKTLRTSDTSTELDFTSRLTYTYQLIIARKFSPSFSFQLLPSLVHRNAVLPNLEGNDIYALGAGGRMKLSKRLSLNAEYYYQLNRIPNSIIQNSIALGVDIETGGHVFQLQLTNSQAMIEKGFITETTGNFFRGDIHFGFNISRTFQLH